MKKIILFGVTSLSVLIMSGCGNSSSKTRVSTPSIQSNSEKQDNKISEKKLKSIVTDTSNDLVDMINKSQNLKTKKDEENYKKYLSDVKDKLNKQLNELNDSNSANKNFRKDTINLIETAKTIAQAMLDSNSNMVSAASETFGSQLNNIANNYLDGELPKKMDDLLKEENAKKGNSDTANKKTAQTEPKNATKKTYGLGEWWEVPGQWKLKIDSVTPTEERNQFSEKTPQQVVIITYSYENIGYEKKVQDLYMRPRNVIDSKGVMGETYPATYTSPSPTPIGATMNGAQAAYGIQNEGGNIKITFENYDSDSKNQTAVFEVPIQ